MHVVELQRSGYEQWLSAFRALRQYPGYSTFSPSFACHWTASTVCCGPDGDASVGCTLRRSRYGAFVLATSAEHMAASLVIEGSLLFDINGVVVVMEPFQSILRRLEAIRTFPICLRFISDGSAYDVVFWEQDLGVVWCGASDVAQVESTSLSGLAHAAGVKPGDIIIQIDDNANNDLTYAYVVERLRHAKDTPTNIDFIGVRQDESFKNLSMASISSASVGTEEENANPNPPDDLHNKSFPSTTQETLYIPYSSILQDFDDKRSNTIGLHGSNSRYRNFLHERSEKPFILNRWHSVAALFLIKSSSLKLHKASDASLSIHFKNNLLDSSVGADTGLRWCMLQLTQLLGSESLVAPLYRPISFPLCTGPPLARALNMQLFAPGDIPRREDPNAGPLSDPQPRTAGLAMHLIESCLGSTERLCRLFWNLKSSYNELWQHDASEYAGAQDICRADVYLLSMVLLLRYLATDEELASMQSAHKVLTNIFSDLPSRDQIVSLVVSRGASDLNSDQSGDIMGSSGGYPATQAAATSPQRDSGKIGHQQHALALVDLAMMRMPPGALELGAATDQSMLVNTDRVSVSSWEDSEDDENSTIWRVCESKDSMDEPSPEARSPSSRLSSSLTRRLHGLHRDVPGFQARDGTAVEVLSRQSLLTDMVRQAVQEVHANIHEGHAAREERLRAALSRSVSALGDGELWPVPSPLRPEQLTLKGLIYSKCKLLKSSKYPVVLAFETDSPEPHLMLYKRDDDVRQDEFVLQLIDLIDSILKADNLDLKLTAYKVLTTGRNEGYIEWVPDAAPLSLIIQEYSYEGNPIQTYMRQWYYESNVPLNIREEVMENYLRSCAGYCVLTYVLGVGDRHLDNILLRPSGEFLHVDFGYIFGRDPKPFKAQLRFTQEMLVAMGGEASAHYETFLRYSTLAYNSIRHSSTLLLNCIYLMRDAKISDLSVQQQPLDAIIGTSERLHLEMDDGHAADHIRAVIADSLSALMPVVMENIHRIAVKFR